MIRARVEVKHSKDCAVVASIKRGERSTPWSGVLDESRPIDYGLTRTGRPSKRRFPGYVWWRVLCNDSSCPARLLVSADDVLANAKEAR